jgi:plasmid stability protein
MSTMIQIRNVPDGLHRRAKARAALLGVTLSDFALLALEREMERPTAAEVAARIGQLEEVADAPPGAMLVREERDAR